MIVAYQHRPLSDLLFRRLIHFFCSISGDFWFALVAHSNDAAEAADELVGKVVIFKSREDWRASGETVFRRAIYELNNLRFSLDKDRDDRSHAIYERAFREVRHVGDIEISFELKRDGEVSFSKPTFHDSLLEAASTQYARDHGHDFRKWLADQAYFFLRDISHTHQHHEPDSDTILILQERDADNIQWRKNIIYALYYAIISGKRTRQALTLHQAVGIQAYCSSFKTICQSVLKEKFTDLPMFDDNALRASLEARANEETARWSERSAFAASAFARASNWRTFALALVAIIIAAMGILIQPRINSTDSSKFKLLNRASDYAAEHFFAVIAGCCIVLLVTWILTRPSWILRAPLARDVLELSNVRRVRFLWVYFVAAIVVALLSIASFWPAILDMAHAVRDLFRLIWP